MKFNLNILAACLSQSEGKAVSAETARHIANNATRPKSNNAARLLAALPLYKSAILEQLETSQNGFDALESELKAIAESRENSRPAKRERMPNIALIAGQGVRFDRVGKRNLRGIIAAGYEYIGAGEVLQISGWQSRRFQPGDKARFWVKK